MIEKLTYIYQTFMEYISMLRELTEWAISNGFNAGQVFLILLVVLFYILAFRPFKKTMTGDISDVKNNFSDLHNATREIQHHLKNRKTGKLNPVHDLNKLQWATANSPFVLNGHGQDLAMRSGINNIITVNLELLLKLIEDCHPATGFDLEIAAFKTLASFIETKPDLEKHIKDFIFNNPVYEDRELGLQDIYFVGSLMLRDRYIERHPEITQ